jgi:imidazole glycerol phosphate synthase subunit HisF
MSDIKHIGGSRPEDLAGWLHERVSSGSGEIIIICIDSDGHFDATCSDDTSLGTLSIAGSYLTHRAMSEMFGEDS